MESPHNSQIDEDLKKLPKWKQTEKEPSHHVNHVFPL